MVELNKFKITTVVFLCLFIFTVGIIYTNTKEMAEHNAESNFENKKSDYKKELNYEYQKTRTNASEIRDLNEKLNELTRRLNVIEDNNGKMNCKIRGYMGEDGFQQLSEEISLADARANGKEIVLTCSF